MKLSIIVPVYNTEKYLRECVDSILAQTFTDFECILVDDGSTDGCPAICDEYAKKDPRVVVIHKENGGLSDARNAGLDVAKGDYIGFVDSDDYIDPGMYEHLYNISLLHNSDITRCNMRCIYAEEISTGENTAQEDQNVEILSAEFILNSIPKYPLGASSCNKLFKNTVFSSIRFPVGKLYEDSYIEIDVLDVSNIVILSPKTFYNYRQRADSIMHSSYSFKKTSKIDALNHRISFFEQKNLKPQAEYSVFLYLDIYAINYFAVYLHNKEHKKAFSPYKKQAVKRFPDVIKNPYTCTFKKIIFILMHISPKLSYKICIKYFPEMTGIGYDEWTKMMSERNAKNGSNNTLA